MTPDQQIAREIASHLDHALAYDRALARGLPQARSRARARAGDDDLLRDPAIARALRLNGERVRALAGASILARDLASTSARDLEDLTRDLKALSGARVGRRATRDLERARAHVRSLMRPARLACRLLAIAAWLVPTRQRARYGEEYYSELHDLAAAGAGRRQQLGYAVRLLVRAAPLRVAVLAPRHGKASP